MTAAVSRIDEQQECVERLSKEYAQMQETRQIETRSVTARARAVTEMVQKSEKMESEVSQLQQFVRQMDLRIATSVNVCWAHISSNHNAIVQIQVRNLMNFTRECQESMAGAFRNIRELQTDAPSAVKN